MSDTPLTAYKVLTANEMAALERDGRFAGAPLDLEDGYIHLSTADQLTETVDRHFGGQADLWLAAVDLEAQGDCLKWEASRGGQLFPHLYGVLELDTVIAYGPLKRGGGGGVEWADGGCAGCSGECVRRGYGEPAGSAGRGGWDYCYRRGERYCWIWW